jgi:hypothetical protein
MRVLEARFLEGQDRLHGGLLMALKLPLGLFGDLFSPKTSVECGLRMRILQRILLDKEGFDIVAHQIGIGSQMW